MSVAISAAVASNGNAAASVAARRARDAECRIVVKMYDHAAAGVEQMREFAACVQHLYPQPMSGLELLFAKALVISGVVGLIGGFVKGLTSDDGVFENRFVAAVCYAFFGSVLMPLGGLILGAVAAGVMMVVS